MFCIYNLMSDRALPVTSIFNCSPKLSSSVRHNICHHKSSLIDLHHDSGARVGGCCHHCQYSCGPFQANRKEMRKSLESIILFWTPAMYSALTCDKVQRGLLMYLIHQEVSRLLQPCLQIHNTKRYNNCVITAMIQTFSDSKVLEC